jgi:hypothetical protein
VSQGNILCAVSALNLVLFGSILDQEGRCAISKLRPAFIGGENLHLCQ